MENTKREIVVLCGRIDQFFFFAREIQGARIYRSRVMAETQAEVYRGFTHRDRMDGLDYDKVMTCGDYYRRFSPEDVAFLRGRVRRKVVKVDCTRHSAPNTCGLIRLWLGNRAYHGED